jgi:hypothetical protein
MAEAGVGTVGAVELVADGARELGRR